MSFLRVKLGKQHKDTKTSPKKVVLLKVIRK